MRLMIDLVVISIIIVKDNPTVVCLKSCTYCFSCKKNIVHWLYMGEQSGGQFGARECKQTVSYENEVRTVS